MYGRSRLIAFFSAATAMLFLYAPSAAQDAPETPLVCPPCVCDCAASSDGTAAVNLVADIERAAEAISRAEAELEKTAVAP